MSDEHISFVSSYNAGKSLEDRDLRVLKIKTANTKRSIWLDCGIHAREWLSPATCIWIIDRVVSYFLIKLKYSIYLFFYFKLVNEYKSHNPITRKLLNYFEMHILTVFNPDGYDYSFKVNIYF